MYKYISKLNATITVPISLTQRLLRPLQSLSLLPELRTQIPRNVTLVVTITTLVLCSHPINKLLVHTTAVETEMVLSSFSLSPSIYHPPINSLINYAVTVLNQATILFLHVRPGVGNCPLSAAMPVRHLIASFHT